MTLRCEAVAKYVLPVFRALTAKELVNVHHLTQTDAAKKLGTTQAAISQYLSSKRAIRGSEQFEAMLPKIQAMASETARRLIESKVSWDEVSLDFCKLCSATFVEENKTGDTYSI